MTTTAYDVREYRARCANDHFKKHVATLTRYTAPDGKVVEHLRWAEPGTGVGLIDYVTRAAYLFVSGDLGDAVYCRAEGLEWWAGCDLDYFASKCDASETGRGFKEWDYEQAKRRSEEHFDETLTADHGDQERARERYEYFNENDGRGSLHSEQEWCEWLREHGREAFGDDYYEFAMFGRVVAVRCALHLEGLKRAMRQLGDSAKLIHREASSNG